MLWVVYDINDSKSSSWTCSVFPFICIFSNFFQQRFVVFGIQVFHFIGLALIIVLFLICCKWYCFLSLISGLLLVSVYRSIIVVYCFCVGFTAGMGFPGSLDGKASAYNVGDPGSIPGSGTSPGEGNGNPLQYSCLENPMDRGAWWATVHGVAKSWTRLSNFSSNLCWIHWLGLNFLFLWNF